MEKYRESGWNEQTVVEAINKLLQNNLQNKETDNNNVQHNEYVKNVEKIKIIMKFSGGVKRAAEVIEMVSDLKGDLSWTMIDNHLSIIQYYCLDIIITYLLIFILILYFIIKVLSIMIKRSKAYIKKQK
ncbi:hypothetical protein ABK040_009011 [Willaertia magna]